MCGIAGFVGLGDAEDLKRMTSALIHRGPDAEGFWQDRETAVFLGHRRLSIIDLHDGAQPMTTADGALTVTYNGEIYNHAALRKELERLGHRFVTDHSDTEVLLHGYRQWGAQLPGRLNGMWAFALYDRRRQRLFLSRDRFGKKPLYYTSQAGLFAFASELSALVRHRLIQPTVSKISLMKYFGYGYIPAPRSIFKQIHKLPGGQNLTVDLPSIDCRSEVYWDFVLEPTDSIPANPEATWGEELRALIAKAVQRRMMADVPLGVFLSGGIDSSSVAAFAQQHTNGQPVKTFSIGFEEKSFDESPYAARVAGELETHHFAQTLSLEGAKKLMPRVVSRLDEPMGDSSLLPTYLLCQSTRKHVTVALGGDGADELFAGYDPFKALAMARMYEKLVPKPLHRGIRMLAGRMPVAHRNMSLDFKVKRTLRGLDYQPDLWCPVWMGPLEPKELAALFQSPIDPEELYSEAIEQWDACRQPDLVDKTLQFYTRLYLQDDILVKVDRASMMNSLEVRAPYLDIELVDFVRKIPSRFKFRNGQTKYLLKKALEPILPKPIVHRTKKGFGIPIGRWLRNGVAMIDPQTSSKFLNADFIRSQIGAHQAGKADNRAFLWNLWVLERWGLGIEGLRD